MLALIVCGADDATLLAIKAQGSNMVTCCRRPRDVLAGSTAAIAAVATGSVVCDSSVMIDNPLGSPIPKA